MSKAKRQAEMKAKFRPGLLVTLSRVRHPGYVGLQGVVEKYVARRGVVRVRLAHDTYDADPENLDVAALNVGDKVKFNPDRCEASEIDARFIVVELLPSNGPHDPAPTRVVIELLDSGMTFAPRETVLLSDIQPA